MPARAAWLSRQVAFWGICLVDKLVWKIFFSSCHVKWFLAICNTASEIPWPGANTGLVSSAFFIGLHGAHATWDAMRLQLAELEPVKITISYNSLICPFQGLWILKETTHIPSNRSGTLTLPIFVGSQVPIRAISLRVFLRLCLAVKSGPRVAVVVGINCFLPKFCSAFGAYLMLAFTDVVWNQ